MKIEKIQLESGLYFVSTPIGAARDITLRSLDILASADVLAAEDTRSLRRLMQIHGVALAGRQIVAYHDHNGSRVRPRLIGLISDGKSVVYASEAGTPLIADPGFPLAKAVLSAGMNVTAAPGPSAALTALTLSGLPSDRFLFVGFPPAQAGARRTWLTEILAVPATLIVYESPKRIARTLADINSLGSGLRDAALCRELTKRFEDVRRGSVAAIATDLTATAPKGEIVLVIDRDRAQPSKEGVEEALLIALKEMSVKDAATAVADRFGVKRRDVYQLALSIEDKI